MTPEAPQLARLRRQHTPETMAQVDQLRVRYPQLTIEERWDLPEGCVVLLLGEAPSGQRLHLGAVRQPNEPASWEGPLLARISSDTR